MSRINRQKLLQAKKRGSEITAIQKNIEERLKVFTIGTLIRVIGAPDQSGYTRRFQNQIGLIVGVSRVNEIFGTERLQVLIEEKVVSFHPLDVEVL